MRILDDFTCTRCGLREERLHDQGESVLTCSACGGDANRVWPRLQHVENFGALGVHHTPGRRLSPAEQERRDHYRQTRHKDPNPRPMTPRPKVFDGRR